MSAPVRPESPFRRGCEPGVRCAPDALLPLLVLAPVWGSLLWTARHYELDDALIYCRYLRNLREHGQLVYNLGERFNGLTSPLYAYVSVGIALLAKDIVCAENLACGVLLLGAAAVLQAVFAAAAGRLAGALAAALVLVSPFFYACLGMETSQFMLLTVLSLHLLLRERFAAMSVALGLLLITRTEGVFLIAAMGIEMLRQHGVHWLWRRRLLVLPVVLPTVAVTVWNGFYYGQALPHTAMAKFWQGASGYWGRWPFAFIRIRYQIDWLWGGNIWLCIATAALLLLGMWRLRGSRLNRVVLPFLAFYAGTFTLLNVPNYHWYYAAFYFFGLAYAGVGLAAVLQRAYVFPRPVSRALAVGATVLLAGAVLLAPAQITWSWAQQLGPQPQYRAVARWLTEHAAPGASVAAVEIGAIGWYCDRPVIDVLGLVTPDNARAIAHHDVHSWLGRYHPDFVIVHNPLSVFEEALRDAELRGEYAPVPDAAPPGLRLLQRRTPF